MISIIVIGISYISLAILPHINPIFSDPWWASTGWAVALIWFLGYQVAQARIERLQ